MRKPMLLGIAAVAVITALAIRLGSEPALNSPARERMDSPDGRFEATVRSSFWPALGLRLFGTTLPGHSGDRPGRVTVYDKATGKPCGSAPVALVNNVTLDWDMEENIASLGRPRDAVWDLSNCRIRFDDLYPG